MEIKVNLNVKPKNFIAGRMKAVDRVVREWQRKWPRDAAEKVRKMLIEKIITGDFEKPLSPSYQAYRDSYRTKNGLEPAKFWRFSDDMINSIGWKKQGVGSYIVGLVNNLDIRMISYVWDNEQIRPLYKPTFTGFIDSNPIPKDEIFKQINKAWKGK